MLPIETQSLGTETRFTGGFSENEGAEELLLEVIARPYILLPSIEMLCVQRIATTYWRRRQNHTMDRATIIRFLSFFRCTKPAFTIAVSALAPIIFLSYCLYSLAGAPWTNVNADTALHALMTYHLEPWDFYYWGQDRLGSIVPFLAAIFVKGFGGDAVYAVTGVVYALLLIGWVGFAILLNNPFLAWTLGVFLLIPPPVFAPLVQAGHPYPGQIFFLGLMAAVFTHWPAPWVPPALIALAGGSIWASDFSLIILGGIAPFALLTKRNLSPFLRPPSLVIGAGVIMFLVTAKLMTQFRLRHLNLFGPGEGIQLFSFSSLDGFFSILRQHGHSLTDLFFSPPYILLFLSGGIAAARLIVLSPSSPKRYSQIALISVVASCLAVAGSRWVELNKGAIRYLSIAFFFLVLAILFAVSAEAKKRWKAVHYGLLFGAVALHLVWLIPQAYGIPGTRETLRPLFISGCAAFIGDYWTAYLVAGMFPNRFLATPHERTTVRSRRIREMVLAQPQICLIKEGWLDEFPDELRQFGSVLKKTGSPQRYGRFTICRYAKEPPS